MTSDRPAWADQPVELVPPDPTWHRQGQELCRRVDAIAGPWATGPAEHVGSTSVPGLVAKPIIDLQIGVAAGPGESEPARALMSDDWHLVPPELDRRPWRRLFVRAAGNRRVAHLHVMSGDETRLRDQLLFRDALRRDPALVARYAAIKRASADAHPDDREAYTAGKESFVAEVVSSAHGSR